MKNIYFVYCILDTTKKGNFVFDNIEFEYEPFYIGKGKGMRYKNHLMSSQLKRDTNKMKVNKILKIFKSGTEPKIIKLYENLNEDVSLLKEKHLINVIGRKDYGKGPLTNLTNGGEICCKFNELNIETQNNLKKQRSDFMTNNNPMKNKDVSIKVSNFHKGTIRTDEYKKEMSEKIKNSQKHKEGTRSKENRERQRENQRKNMKPIFQYDKNMVFLNEYESITEASRQLNIKKGSISGVLHGRQKTTNNFIFKFKNKDEDIC